MKSTKLMIFTMVTATLLIAPCVIADENAESAEGVTAKQPKIRLWSLRFGFVAAETKGQTSVNVDPESVDIGLSGGGGGFVTLERKVTPLLGLEFGTTTIGTDMNVSAHTDIKHVGSEVDVLTLGALSFGANFHFVRDSAIDVYAGPLIAYNRYSKWSAQSGFDDDWWSDKHCDWGTARLKSDSELTWGAKVGFDVVLSKRGNWALGASLTYLNATYSFEQESGGGKASVDLDPIMFSFGASFRF